MWFWEADCRDKQEEEELDALFIYLFNLDKLSISHLFVCLSLDCIKPENDTRSTTSRVLVENNRRRGGPTKLKTDTNYDLTSGGEGAIFVFSTSAS